MSISLHYAPAVLMPITRNSYLARYWHLTHQLIIRVYNTHLLMHYLAAILLLHLFYNYSLLFIIIFIKDIVCICKYFYIEYTCIPTILVQYYYLWYTYTTLHLIKLMHKCIREAIFNDRGPSYYLQFFASILLNAYFPY